MHLIFSIALLILPADSLDLVRECRGETEILKKISECRLALVEMEYSDALFEEIVFSEVKPSLDSLITLRDSVATLLKEGGVGWFGRRRYDFAAALLGWRLDATHKDLLKTQPNMPARRRFITLLKSLLALADDIRNHFPAHPKDA